MKIFYPLKRIFLHLLEKRIDIATITIRKSNPVKLYQTHIEISND